MTNVTWNRLNDVHVQSNMLHYMICKPTHIIMAPTIHMHNMSMHMPSLPTSRHYNVIGIAKKVIAPFPSTHNHQPIHSTYLLLCLVHIQFCSRKTRQIQPPHRCSFTKQLESQPPWHINTHGQRSKPHPKYGILQNIQTSHQTFNFKNTPKIIQIPNLHHPQKENKKRNQHDIQHPTHFYLFLNHTT